MKRNPLKGLMVGLTLGLFLADVFPAGSLAYLLFLLAGWLTAAVSLNQLCVVCKDFRAAKYAAFAPLLFRLIDIGGPDYRLCILLQALYMVAP